MKKTSLNYLSLILTVAFLFVTCTNNNPIEPDTTSPVLVLNDDIFPKLTNTDTVIISGFVQNFPFEDKVILTVSNGSVTKKQSIVRGSFWEQIQLKQGINTIIVNAFDNAGNQAVDSAVVENDSRPPIISISTPDTSERIINFPGPPDSANLVKIIPDTIQGIVSDSLPSSGLQSLEITYQDSTMLIPLDSITVSSDSIQNAGFKVFIELKVAAGENLSVPLEFTATDTAGNKTVFTRNVIFEFK